MGLHRMAPRAWAAAMALIIAGSARAGKSADDTAYVEYLDKFRSGVILTELEKAGRSKAEAGTRLRELFARTSHYRPYADPSEPIAKNASKLRRDGKCAEAIIEAEKALDMNYTSLLAHYVAGNCAVSIGHPRKEEWIRSFALFLGAIIKPPERDGKSPKSAFKVLSVNEEYVLMGVLGVKHGNQSLLAEGGISADCFDVRDPKPNEGKQVCFDVSLPMGQLNRELGGR